MLLKCQNLSYKYPRSNADIFQNISFHMDTPGFHALFGPSGVGKTSLAKVMAKEINGNSGTLEILENATILYTYNQERLPGWGQIGQLLDRVTPSVKIKLKDELIAIFDMTDCMALKFSQLSLGQKNRINLIRYLLQDFDILIMDESLANVDERLRETIILHIKALFPEKYFLYISHNVLEVAKFCHHILILKDVSKSPQCEMITGIDLKQNSSFQNKDIDPVVLEMMNAC